MRYLGDSTPEPTEPEPAELELKNDSALTPPSQDGAAQSAPPRHIQQLGSALLAQLSGATGLWAGMVPISAFLTGAPVGGFSGGLIWTVMLITSAHIYLGEHPTIPYNVILHSYGWEIIRRKDGHRRYILLSNRVPLHVLENIERDRIESLDSAKPKSTRRKDAIDRRLARAKKRSKRLLEKEIKRAGGVNYECGFCDSRELDPIVHRSCGETNHYGRRPESYWLD